VVGYHLKGGKGLGPQRRGEDKKPARPVSIRVSKQAGCTNKGKSPSQKGGGKGDWAANGGWTQSTWEGGASINGWSP